MAAVGGRMQLLAGAGGVQLCATPPLLPAPSVAWGCGPSAEKLVKKSRKKKSYLLVLDVHA